MAERCRAYDRNGPPGFPIRRCTLDAGHAPLGHDMAVQGPIGQSKGTAGLELIEDPPNSGARPGRPIDPSDVTTESTAAQLLPADLITDGLRFRLEPGDYLVFRAKATMSRPLYDEMMRLIASTIPEGVRWMLVPVPDLDAVQWSPSPIEIEAIAEVVYQRMAAREQAGYRHHSGATILGPNGRPHGTG